MNRRLRIVAAGTATALGMTMLTSDVRGRATWDCLAQPGNISQEYPAVSPSKEVIFTVPRLSADIFGLVVAWRHADPKSLADPKNRWYYSDPVPETQLEEYHHEIGLRVGNGAVQFETFYAVGNNDPLARNLSPPIKFGPDSQLWQGPEQTVVLPTWSGQQFTPSCEI